MECQNKGEMKSLTFCSYLKRLSFGLCLLSGLFPANSPAQAPS
jgi:hypothetical protein